MRRSGMIGILAGLLSVGTLASPGYAQVPIPRQDSQRGYFPPGTPNQAGQYQIPGPGPGQSLTNRPFGGFYPERSLDPSWAERPLASPWPPPQQDRNLLGNRSITQPPPPPFTQSPAMVPPPLQPPARRFDGGLPGPSSYQRGYAGPAPARRAVAGLADLLANQAEEFLQAFSLDARQVPQGGLFLADATALRNSALRFRDLADQGAPPEVLASEFQAVAANWQQLEGRMALVSRGRIGPNIATALQMGQTVEQISRQLY